MVKEYEYQLKFDDDISEEYLRKKLKKLKAKHYKPIIFKIKTFTHPIEKDIYIRLRDEGYKKTLTIKKNLTAKFVDEYEIIIDNIDTAEQMLLIFGCKNRAGRGFPKLRSGIGPMPLKNTTLFREQITLRRPVLAGPGCCLSYCR